MTYEYRQIEMNLRLTLTEAEWLRDSLGENCPLVRAALNDAIDHATAHPTPFRTLVVGLRR